VKFTFTSDDKFTSDDIAIFFGSSANRAIVLPPAPFIPQLGGVGARGDHLRSISIASQTCRIPIRSVCSFGHVLEKITGPAVSLCTEGAKPYPGTANRPASR
jgi:hypothetical protein